MEILIDHENKLPIAATSVLKFAGNEKIFLFEGEMGAGKTTLIKSLCLQLGMVDNVSSPTYSIVNEYVSRKEKFIILTSFELKMKSKHLTLALKNT